MRYAYWSLIGLILICHRAYSHTGVIVGKVLDRQTKAPLPGANIIIQGTTRGAPNGTRRSLTPSPAFWESLLPSQNYISRREPR